MNKVEISNELIKLGFENVTNSSNYCFVNRINSIICYHAQYFEGQKNCFILGYKHTRIPITTLKELQKEYYKLKKTTL